MDLVSCAVWAPHGEFMTFSDDGTNFRWSQEGEFLGVFQEPWKNIVHKTNDGGETNVPTFILDAQWAPSAAKSSGNASAMDTAAFTTSNGKVFLCSKGRVDKVVDAHKGAVLAIRWCPDGSAFATAGEDGQIKIWSRSGMLRSTLVQGPMAILSIAWSSGADAILYSLGTSLVIKSLQPNAKPVSWKAHDGMILQTDWSSYHDGRIISVGEDRRYKVWDSNGRLIFSSPVDSSGPLTCCSWSPSGDVFAIGGVSFVKICDRSGWVRGWQELAHESSKSTECNETAIRVSWAPDGGLLGVGTSTGRVFVGKLVGWETSWKNWNVRVVDHQKIVLTDTASHARHQEEIELRDRIIKVSMGFGHLIVATVRQVHVYDERNLNTPCIMDLPVGAKVMVMEQTQGYFLLVDSMNGVQIFSYDTRLVSAPKYNGMRTDFLSNGTVSLSPDVVAIRDRLNDKSIYLFEVQTGRPIGEQPAVKHHTEILQIGLDQCGPSQNRLLAFTDRNHDLFITQAVSSASSTSPRSATKKLAAMVSSFLWNEQNNALAAVADNSCIVWYYPAAAFVDQDIEPLTKMVAHAPPGSVWRESTLHEFHGTTCALIRSDGAKSFVAGISPFVSVLAELIRQKAWEESVKLCRFVKGTDLWACLAIMSIQANDLNTAEVAYAAIDEVDKVDHICYMKEIASPEIRQAELAMFKRNMKDAENILMAAGLTFYYLKTLIQSFEWERALYLAMKVNAYLDIVLYYRMVYLKSLGRKETNERFLQAAQSITIDSEQIHEKIKAEEERERLRAR